MKEYKTFYLFLLGLIGILMMPTLIQRGMFVDGLWYAAIANNLSNGLGTFWQPVFTQTMEPIFHEHPPLVFWIQSFFFDVFGDNLFVEKLYALVIFIVTMIMIHKVWKEIHFDNEKLKKWSFIPLILWFLCERTYVNFPNNLLECTQGIFILGSVLFILKGIRRNDKKSYRLFLIAGLFLFFAFLSKGFTGLFPLTIFFIYQFCFKNFTIKTSLKYSVVLFLSFIIPLGALFFLVPESFDFFVNYIEKQVITSINGEKIENLQSSRFFIIKRFIESNIAPMALVLLVSIISFFRLKTKDFFKHKKKILFFFLVCMSGLLPIMISEKQAAYYMITVIPYFAISLSFILIRSETLIDKLKKSKIFVAFSLIVLIIASINIYNVKDDYNRRDRILLLDFDLIENQLKEIKGTTIGAIIKTTHDSSYGYMMRMYQVSLDTVNPFKYDIIFSNKDAIKGENNVYLTKRKGIKQYNLFYKSEK